MIDFSRRGLMAACLAAVAAAVPFRSGARASEFYHVLAEDREGRDITTLFEYGSPQVWTYAGGTHFGIRMALPEGHPPVTIGRLVLRTHRGDFDAGLAGDGMVIRLSRGMFMQAAPDRRGAAGLFMQFDRHPGTRIGFVSVAHRAQGGAWPPDDAVRWIHGLGAA